MTSTKQIKSQPSLTKKLLFSFHNEIHLDYLRKCNILSLSCVLSRNANSSYFVSEIIWISINSKTILKEREEEERRRRPSRTQKGKESFNWQTFILLETALSDSHQNRTGTKLTKMQFHRHTRADSIWARNIPAARQVSERTEPHSGSEPLQHKPLSAKKCQSKTTNSGFFSQLSLSDSTAWEHQQKYSPL